MLRVFKLEISPEVVAWMYDDRRQTTMNAAKVVPAVVQTTPWASLELSLVRQTLKSLYVFHEVSDAQSQRVGGFENVSRMIFSVAAIQDGT
jgi:hypothetical protein